MHDRAIHALTQQEGVSKLLADRCLDPDLFNVLQMKSCEVLDETKTKENLERNSFGIFGSILSLLLLEQTDLLVVGKQSWPMHSAALEENGTKRAPIS